MTEPIALPAAALALAAVVPGIALAQNAPPQLHGKSIVATWNENRMQRQAGVGEFRPMVIPNGLSVYVSSTGRMFVRRSAAVRGGRATGSRDSIGASGS